MNETTITAWLARDRNGELWIYGDEKPRKYIADAWTSYGRLMEQIDSNLFPSVKWEDEEPTEVEIIIKLKEK